MNRTIGNINNHTNSILPDDPGREEISPKILEMINCPTILTGMSHEVRTHMNSIVAFSFLIKSNGYNEIEKEEFSNHILSSCEQLMGLFDNFLDSAIIDTGNSRTALRNCNVGNILDELLSEFRVILRREEYKELVLILGNHSSDNVEVSLDSERAARVIRSLFQNSLSNTKSGYIKIGYYFRDSNLIFYVLDSGKGYLKCKEFLSTDNLNESLGKHNDTFSAINISLARKLVLMMGGRIWIEPNNMSGTGIFFSIPARDVAADSGLKQNKYLNKGMQSDQFIAKVS